MALDGSAHHAARVTRSRTQSCTDRPRVSIAGRRIAASVRWRSSGSIPSWSRCGTSAGRCSMRWPSASMIGWSRAARIERVVRLRDGGHRGTATALRSSTSASGSRSARRRAERTMSMSAYTSAAAAADASNSGSNGLPSRPRALHLVGLAGAVLEAHGAQHRQRDARRGDERAVAGEDRHVGVAVGAGEGGRGVGRLHHSLVLAVDDGLPATVRAGLVVQRRQRRGARPRSAVGRMVVQRAARCRAAPCAARGGTRSSG